MKNRTFRINWTEVIATLAATALAVSFTVITLNHLGA